MYELGEYFTEDEFRDVTMDDTAPRKFETEQIDRAHREVIQRLENWARTSWKKRTYRLQKLLYRSQIDLSRGPVISITAFTIGGEDVNDPATYVLDQTAGSLSFGDWYLEGPAPLLEGGPYNTVVEWEYGFDLDADDIPWSIKRPCIQAAKSLMVPIVRTTDVPANARSYSSRGVSIDLRFQRSQTRPWPWDESMSAQVRAEWDPLRWRTYIS
jgi:hypothetical protein